MIAIIINVLFNFIVKIDYNMYYFINIDFRI